MVWEPGESPERADIYAGASFLEADDQPLKCTTSAKQQLKVRLLTCAYGPRVSRGLGPHREMGEADLLASGISMGTAFP